MRQPLLQRGGGRGGGVARPAAYRVQLRPDGAGVGNVARQGTGKRGSAARVGDVWQKLVLPRLHGVQKQQQHGRAPQRHETQIRCPQQQFRAGKLPFLRRLRRQKLRQKQRARRKRGGGFCAEIVQIAAAAQRNPALGVRAFACGGADDEKQSARKRLRPPPPQIRQPRQHGAAEGGVEALGVGHGLRAAGAAARFLKADNGFGGKQPAPARRRAFYQRAQVFVSGHGHGAGEVFITADARETVPPPVERVAVGGKDVGQYAPLRALRVGQGRLKSGKGGGKGGKGRYHGGGRKKRQDYPHPRGVERRRGVFRVRSLPPRDGLITRQKAV